MSHAQVRPQRLRCVTGCSVDAETAERIAQAIFESPPRDLFTGPKLLLDAESRDRVTAALIEKCLKDQPS